MNSVHGGNLPSSTIEEVTFLNTIFPIKTTEDLNNLEKWLAKEKNYKLLVKDSFNKKNRKIIIKVSGEHFLL